MPTHKKKRKFRKTKKQMGNEQKIIELPPHPLSHFIKKKVDGKYFLLISKDNNHLIDLENIYIKCFFERMLDILRISFNREKQYHISLGSYSSNYNHQISTIMNFVNDPNYITAIATDSNLIPHSYLHIERKDNDYDKMWTVCTHPTSRGKGFSSFVISNSLKEQKRNRRKNLLLEVYNDDVINRRDNDPRQSHIMEHFRKHGFNEVDRNQLSPNTRRGLLSEKEETKVMTCNL
jgi:GNAT superfamily N-acetyltransferase